MELHLGKMTNKELAEWFGVTLAYMRQSKKKKLEELKAFADFEEIYGGVDIIKIIEPIYEKKKSESYQIVELAFDEEWAGNGLDTCKNVAIKIKNKHNELAIADSTTEKYALKVRNDKYGRPFTIGDLGRCEYMWCKIERYADGTADLTEFTDEEIKIKDELMKVHFGSDTEKEIIITQMVNEGEITKAEAYDLLVEMKNLTNAGFMAFKLALEEKIGFEIVRGTKIYRGAFENSDEEIKLISN